jgi:hypothetical protein
MVAESGISTFFGSSATVVLAAATLVSAPSLAQLIKNTAALRAIVVSLICKVLEQGREFGGQGQEGNRGRMALFFTEWGNFTFGIELWMNS